MADLTHSYHPPHRRSSLFTPFSLQPWKEGNIICLYFFVYSFYNIILKNAFLCIHRECYSSPTSFTRQGKAWNSPRAHLTLFCKAQEDFFLHFFFNIKSHSVIKRNCSIPLIGSEDKFFPQPGGHGHQQLFISCIDWEEQPLNGNKLNSMAKRIPYSLLM